MTTVSRMVKIICRSLRNDKEFSKAKEAELTKQNWRCEQTYVNLFIYLVNYTFFYKNNFIRTRGSFVAQNLRTIPASAKEQSLKFSVKVVNKTLVKIKNRG